jgi:hypothetical protein
MLFLINWEIYAERKAECNKLFSQMTTEDENRDFGEEIKLVGRWHELGGSRGICVCKTDNEKAIWKWVQNWREMCKIEIAPVVDDDDVRAILKSNYERKKIKSMDIYNEKKNKN